ncbi:MAG TPA: hypothetical protein PK054_06480 [Anaerohalosphaeraceae bacterium]|nr:hypothetical protein [Anaerohalosphaeraceae bacterium]HOL88637.1 hypothetical protein [Anaerohalosphaeraceae bacterium]HOQ04205.1 hypothetical protein [Anaerohalosphaeraceae bacterium]HPP56215.1 hypothetical protein [Anaerohalosphaeraceae bacterium]
MDYQAILDEFLELLSSQGVQVRQESMGGGGGGLCEIRGRMIFFLDTQASALDSAVQAGKAVLKVIEDPETIFLKPAVRDFLDRVRQME